MLASIRSTDDLRALSYPECASLCTELREEILRTVAANGGHLASNLGVVETTLAIHRLFRTPEDTLIFDVGHQCYAHKLLTGRLDRFHTLRQFGGLSGFTSHEESPYDTVSAGHCGTSLSVALGVAEANRAAGNGRYTVCVIGDGAFTNGMIYEALDNCARHRELRLIILLNDNKMSISKNVGGFSDYLNRVRTSRRYYAFKRRLERFLRYIPLIGNALANIARGVKDFLKRMVWQNTVFDNLGIPYFGTVDGHDQRRLEQVIAEAKAKDGLCLIHVLTRKGKGYTPAEQNPDVYHSVGPFDREHGALPQLRTTFSSVFGETMCELAEEDPAVCAVTAAMCDGTGLAAFARRYPHRFFDVGIAEEHAVAFSGGLALKGLHPVCVLYSTFAQRVYDQLFHDIALQGVPAVLALDRSGLVPGDGRTHQGLYDIALFSSIPGVEIWSPETFDGLRHMLADAVRRPGLTVVRYPKGGERDADRTVFSGGPHLMATGEEQPEVTVVTYGRLTANVLSAHSLLRGHIRVRVVKLLRVFPLDSAELLDALGGAPAVAVVEEGILAGGVGEKIAAVLAEAGYPGRVSIRAVENRFIPCGDLSSLEQLLCFTPRQIADFVEALPFSGER